MSELKHYAVVSTYLFVCFAVVLGYAATLTPAQYVEWPTMLGSALVKALVLGKFVLIGEALGSGSRVAAPTLLHRIAWRSLGLVIVLIVLKLLEELVVGTLHGERVAEIARGLTAAPWRNLGAPSLMMLLVLIPMVTATELTRAIGADTFRRLLLGPEPSDR